MTGERIKDIRVGLGLTMEEFAKRIDNKAKSGTVSNWETGKNLPNNNRLKQIAKLGNVSVGYLLGGEKRKKYDNAIETGGRIKKARVEKGLSMEQLGERLIPSASKGAVSNWENGYNLPNNSRLAQLSEVLGVSTNYLLNIAEMTELEFYKHKNKFLLDRTFDLLMLMPTKQQAEIIQEMRKCLEDEY